MRRLGNLRKSEAAFNMKPMNSLVNKELLGLNSLEMKFSRANRVAGATCVGEGQVQGASEGKQQDRLIQYVKSNRPSATANESCPVVPP